MESLSKDSHNQLLEVWRYWKRLYDSWLSGHWTDLEFKQREWATLMRLKELCAPEIREAFDEVGIERMFEEYDSCVYSSIRRAVSTVTNCGNKLTVEEHVKACVKEALQRFIEGIEE